MTTFNDDMIRVEMEGGTKMFRCKDLGIDWPPPEEIDIYGFTFVKVGQSQLTDKMMETITKVIRGAQYEPKKEEDIEEMDGSEARHASVEELY